MRTPKLILLAAASAFLSFTGVMGAASLSGSLADADTASQFQIASSVQPVSPQLDQNLRNAAIDKLREELGDSLRTGTTVSTQDLNIKERKVLGPPLPRSAPEEPQKRLPRIV